MLAAFLHNPDPSEHPKRKSGPRLGGRDPLGGSSKMRGTAESRTCKSVVAKMAEWPQGKFGIASKSAGLRDWTPDSAGGVAASFGSSETQTFGSM